MGLGVETLRVKSLRLKRKQALSKILEQAQGHESLVGESLTKPKGPVYM